VNDPILVQPLMPLIRATRGISPDEAVEGLIEDLRAAGLDARISHDEDPQPQEGGAPFDLILLWVVSSAGGAVIAEVVRRAIDWAIRQHRRYPEQTRPRIAQRRAAAEIGRNDSGD